MSARPWGTRSGRFGVGPTSRRRRRSRLSAPPVYVAWLVHLRCLITFFRTEQVFGDEVLACHFMDDPARWARDHESELRLSDGEKERVNRMDHRMAHITYNRLKEASDFGPLDHQIAVKRLRIFYATLPARYKPRFPALAALAR